MFFQTINFSGAGHLTDLDARQDLSSAINSFIFPSTSLEIAFSRTAKLLLKKAVLGGLGLNDSEYNSFTGTQPDQCRCGIYLVFPGALLLQRQLRVFAAAAAAAFFGTFGLRVRI
jgi:hypothetical protein